jgi:Fur family transcriptional regulator, zinc uptake regulator
MVEKYIEFLQRHGYKCTRHRLDILMYFQHHQGELTTPKQLVQAIRRSTGRVSIATIYRNLAIFKDLHILGSVRLKGESRYFLKGIHCVDLHVFICTECFTKREIHEGISGDKKGLIQNWLVDHVTLITTGRCLYCLRKRRRVSPGDTFKNF